MTSITAVVLTYNEALHIERCLTSLDGFVDRIVIVDSFSTDSTVEIAAQFGADVYQNPWTNYSIQFQWAIDNTDISTDWILRIDADEYPDDTTKERLRDDLSLLADDITDKKSLP